MDIGVSAAALRDLDGYVGRFVASRDADFGGRHSVQLAACGDPLKVGLNVSVEYGHNGVDGAKLARARSDLLQVISESFISISLRLR